MKLATQFERNLGDQRDRLLARHGIEQKKLDSLLPRERTLESELNQLREVRSDRVYFWDGSIDVKTGNADADWDFVSDEQRIRLELTELRAEIARLTQEISAIEFLISACTRAKITAETSLALE